MSAPDRAEIRARRILERLTGSSESIDASDARLDTSRLAERLEQIEQLFLLHGGERGGSFGPSSDEILFQWGHLQVLERLGEGSFGEVFRAYDRALDRDVALKLLKTGPGRPFQSQLFLHEARQLAMVRHRHVLAVHGAAVHDGRPGLWTDLIKGVTAADESLRESLLELDPTLELVESLALALKAVHEAGLVHGDIKPSNLMRDASGEWVLMDFGASRAARSTAEAPSLTSGTPLFMAPEVVLGEPPDAAADRYSMGATLYRVLTGTPPYPAEDWAALRAAHREGMSCKPAATRPRLDARVGRLIDRLMARDPDRRATLEAVVDEIRAIREAPHRRFRRIALGSLAGVLLIGLTATSIGFYRADQARQAAEIEQQNSAGVNRFLQRVLATPSSTGRAGDLTVEQMLLQAAEDVGPALEAQAAARAVVHRVLAESFNTLRLPERAREQIEIAERVLTDAGLSMPDIERGLQLQRIRALEIDARHEQSIALAEAFVEQHLEALGKDHGNIRWARKSLVTNRFALSQYDEAQQLMEAHFSEIPEPETAESHFGYEILQSWANLHRVQGRYQESVDAAERALDWLDRYPLARPINRNSALTNLALNLAHVNRPERSIEVLQDLLPIQERMFGQGSGRYVATLINLAAVQRDAGQVEAAGRTLEAAIDLIGRHPESVPPEQQLVVRLNLANIVNALGDAEQAEALMRETHQRAIDLWGPTHQHVVTQEYNLAELLSEQGRYDEAAVLAERTLATKREAFGAEHPLTLLSMDNLAVALAGLGRSEEALALHDQALTALAGQLGSEHPFALLVERHRMATLQQFMPEEIEADAIEALLRRYAEALGEHHPDTEKARTLLAKRSPPPEA